MQEFEKTEFSAESFSKLGDVTGAEFYTCIFRGIDTAMLTRSKRLRFIDCQFHQCNLSNLSVLGFIFRDAVFQGCKVVGINWSLCSALTNPSFSDCKMDLSSFQGLPLKGLRCVDCSAKDADFAGADLSESNFSGTQLVGASFNGSNLTAADFREATEYSINPVLAKVKGARFRFPAAASLLAALGIRVDG